MEVKIFHTNDIHSALNNYVKFKGFLNDKRHQYRDNMIYVDIGDHVDRSHPYTEATLGKGNVDLLNEAGCDVATIGNNEGITLTQEQLAHLYDDADFDVICANLRDVGASEPFFKPYIIKEIKGVKIGFIAATVEFTPFYLALDWEVQDAFLWIERYLNELKRQVDVIVMLSHLGMYDDENLANRFPEIDLILSSHTHHHFDHGEEINGVLLAAAGRYGEYIGEVTLKFHNNTLIDKRAKLIESDFLAPKENGYYNIGKEMLDKSILKDQAYPIERRLYSASRFTSLLAYMIRDFTNSDVGLIHTGLVASPFEGGKLTDFSLHKVLPHAINAVKIELTGREIKEVFTQANRHEYKDEIVRGLGFRGDIFGCFVIDNISYVQSEREYYIGEDLIDDAKIYTLGTLDMYTFGRIFPQFRYSKKEYLMPDLLRDIVKNYIEYL